MARRKGAVTKVDPAAFDRPGAQVFDNPVKTEIEGLFLCGASTLAHGVFGAHLSGLAAAARALGCRTRDLVKEGGDEIRFAADIIVEEDQGIGGVGPHGQVERPPKAMVGGEGDPPRVRKSPRGALNRPVG